MSPLARSLLALACAALLHAAFARRSHPSECRTDKQGTIHGLEIKLPEIKIETSRGPVVDFEIPDNCKELHKLRLHGETAEACDYNAEPNVDIFDHFGKVQVKRNKFRYDKPDATLQVNQYCAT